MRRSVVIGIVFGLVVGIAIGAATALVPRLLTKSVNTDWNELVVSPQNFGVVFSSDALFSDIPPPDITAFTGRYKFLDSISAPGEVTKLGYLITLTMAQIDLSKVPSEYAKPTELEINGHKTTALPIDAAWYGVVFKFHLKDKDGFELIELSSAQEDVTSGKANRYQTTIEKPVPFDIAFRTRSVTVQPAFEKCLTCLH